MTKDEIVCSTNRFWLDVTENHECAGHDWLVLGVLSLVVHAISWWPRWFIYEPFFFHQMQTSYITETGKKIKANKFAQSLTAASFHIIMAILAWNVLRDKDWVWNVEKWSEGLSSSTYDRSALMGIDSNFKLYYLLYAARYTSDFISLFFEHVRSDTVAYGIHHVITVGLVLLSAHVGCIRAGGVIMFFFDWADPFMMVGKTVLYLSQDAHDVYQQVADICMGLFVLFFFVTRNVLFNVVVYVCVRDFSNAVPHMITLKVLLVALSVLMTFWLWIIVRAIYNQFFLKEGHVEDIRENDGTCHANEGDSKSKKDL